MSEEKKAKGKKQEEGAKKEVKKSVTEQDKEVKVSSEKPAEKGEGQVTLEKKEEKKELSVSSKLKDIIAVIEKMTLMELSELVKALEEKFGISAAAPMMSAPGAVAASPKEAAEEKSSFEIVLSAMGDKKIQVIKEIRAITTLGLKEAKDLVEQAPKTVKKDVSKEEAEEIKKKLEAVGAKVEIK
ncbi:MAG: 50S ribosomal protein L7/L12 [Candidatus Omnitrophica bacterium]|nr:50S ribosomal protein L7/L12 [Candidatus Omnitrophota bacterium]